METESQDQLIHAALRAGHLDATAVRKAFQALRARAGSDPDASLDRVLVEEKFLTQDQLEEIRRTIAAERQLPRLGDFEILARIGRGGWGTVYRARQQRLDRVVALKVLASHLAADPDFVRRFLREAHLAARLSHPNIVQVYDVEESAGTHYIVMEHVAGRTLGQFVRSGRPLPEAETLHVALQVAQALKHAAARGIVHRDIKPGNIIITRKGVAKLADLGLAVAAGEQTPHSAGTPFYMSPEQARNDPNPDVRSDIYSLGCTLFHAVTGRVPYAGATTLETLKLHVGAPVIDVREVRPDLSAPFADLLRRMMAKKPEDRFASPEDLIAAIRSVQSPQAPGAAEPTRSRWPWWLIPAAVALILIILLIVWVLAVRMKRDDAAPPAERAVPPPSRPRRGRPFGPRRRRDRSNRFRTGAMHRSTETP